MIVCDDKAQNDFYYWVLFLSKWGRWLWIEFIDMLFLKYDLSKLKKNMMLNFRIIFSIIRDFI